MKLLAFSDLHRDRRRAARLVELSERADAVAAVGDLASVHRGLEETVAELASIDRPAFVVPGNNETEEDLRAACSSWASAVVLHGEGAALDGVELFGLGGGIPITPWDWSFDLDEEEAAARLERCPDGAVMLVHSPPFGHVDVSGDGRHLGSRAVLAAIERKRPPLALCGHIHESWGQESRIGPTWVVNLGPDGAFFDL
jgi:Icc-related predicted phosphoesterase